MAFEAHIKRRASQAEDWMLEASFPLWAQAGVHPIAGFEERLDLQAKPAHDSASRVRLQARQTYCFALAKRLGWHAQMCDELIDRGLVVLTQQCRRPDGLFGKQVHLGQGLVDDRADLYDTAFALLAFCAALDAGRPDMQALVTGLSDAIDETLLRPEGLSGYQEAIPCLGMRLQNPHMHLFEASLAQYRLTQAPSALTRVQAILGYIETCFIDVEAGTLREVIALDGTVHGDDHYEAGHHYEWVWLLDHYARVTGEALPAAARTLYDRACALTHETGRIALSHDLQGGILDTRYRTWSQTEALRAHIAAYRHGWAGPERISQCFDILWADHILPAPAGAWIDCVDSAGARLAQDITAATGYHLFGSFEELMDLAKTL